MDTTIELEDNSFKDLTKSDLENMYFHLKRNYEAIQNDTEEKTQLIYDLKRQLATANALEREYQQEIENLQCGGNIEGERLRIKIQNLEEELKESKKISEVQVQKLEDVILEKEEEIQTLKGELKFFAGNQKNNKTEEFDKVLHENEKLKIEIANLREEVEEIAFKFEEISKQNEVVETSSKVFYFFNFVNVLFRNNILLQFCTFFL